MDEEIQFYLHEAVALDLKTSQMDLLSQTWSNDDEKIEFFWNIKRKNVFYLSDIVMLD